MTVFAILGHEVMTVSAVLEYKVVTVYAVLGQKVVTVYAVYPYFGDEPLSLREYRGGWRQRRKHHKQNVTNHNYINTASLFVRPLINNTFINAARQSTHIIQPFFSRGTVRSECYISHNSSVNASSFLSFHCHKIPVNNLHPLA
jgi:hypothetical protein